MNKLIAIQRELVVTKNQYNDFGKYSYRSSEDILLALKPFLIKYEGVLTVTDDIRLMGEHIYIEAIAKLKIGDEFYQASSFARDPITQKGMTSPQCTNSASSFAKKQALSNLFLIDDTAEVAPSQEEQIKIEEETKEEREKKEKENADWIDKHVKIINEAQSQDELKGVFGAFYREATKKDKNTVDKLTDAYNSRKETLKGEDND